MRIRLLVASFVIAALCASPALARNQSGLKSGQIRIAYVPPLNPAHEPIYRKLMERRILETLQELLSGFRLPKPLLLQLAGCKGDANAWYEGDAVTVCYEFVELVLAGAPQIATPQGITREDAIVGPVADVFLHEAGHALFDLLDVPIFGREEDAADQFAAFILLQLRQEDARKMIGGVAFMLRAQANTQKLDNATFSNIHGLPAQRFFNLVCMAYGSDPKYFADFLDEGYLPGERAESCETEYRQAAHAIRTLIAPHIEPAHRAKMKSALKRFRVPSTWKMQ